MCAPHSAPVPEEPLIIYMINTMTDEQVDTLYDSVDNPNAFFQAVMQSKAKSRIMQQSLVQESMSIPAWHLAILKRNVVLLKMFFTNGLRIAKETAAMDIFRCLVYKNDTVMVECLLNDPSIILELNKQRFYINY